MKNNISLLLLFKISILNFSLRTI